VCVESIYNQKLQIVASSRIAFSLQNQFLKKMSNIILELELLLTLKKHF